MLATSRHLLIKPWNVLKIAHSLEQIVRHALSRQSKVLRQRLEAMALELGQHQTAHRKRIEPKSGAKAVVVREDQAIEMGVVAENGALAPTKSMPKTGVR